MKLQPTPRPTYCCSCSYYALMLLYVWTVVYSLAWPDPISFRGAIACSIRAYTTSDNIPMLTRVWRSKTSRLCFLHWHMLQSRRFCLAAKIFQYVCPIIHHVSTNSESADNASHEYNFKSLDTFLTLKCDNAHNWTVLFLMSYSSFFIQLDRS